MSLAQEASLDFLIVRMVFPLVTHIEVVLVFALVLCKDFIVRLLVGGNLRGTWYCLETLELGVLAHRVDGRLRLLVKLLVCWLHN